MDSFDTKTKTTSTTSTTMIKMVSPIGVSSNSLGVPDVSLSKIEIETTDPVVLQIVEESQSKQTTQLTKEKEKIKEDLLFNDDIVAPSFPSSPDFIGLDYMGYIIDKERLDQKTRKMEKDK